MVVGVSQRQCGRVSVVTPPATLPLSVEDDAKPHLRVEHDDDNDYIEACIRAALSEIDAPHGWLGRSLITRSLRLTLDAYPPPVVYLPGPPTTAITTIHYRNADDEIVKIYDPSDDTDEIGLQSDLTAEPALIWPSDTIGWPSDIKGGIDSVRIIYAAGYANAAAIPERLGAVVQWLKLRTADHYRDRESVLLGITPARNPVADRMLDNLRVRA